MSTPFRSCEASERDMKDFLRFLTVVIPDEVFRARPSLWWITYEDEKIPERRAFGYFLQVLLFESGLADAVDVTGEVEHLVGEAPLIVIPLLRYSSIFLI